MKIEEFESRQLELLNDFIVFWKYNAKSDTKYFPSEMDAASWQEQYETYVDINFDPT